MYCILKSFNETTKLAEKDNKIFVLKRIFPEDIEVYKKLAAIDNEHIVKIYETVLIENDFYAVSEFVQGDTLESYVKKNGFLNDAKVREAALQLCSGLEAIHSQGIVHRDINPSNVMVDENGTLKIIDFGISRIKKADSRTDTHLLGTQGYAPPEQYGFSQTGYESDIYSVGVLMNYLKNGCTVTEKLCDGSLVPIILKCTQVDKNNRYRSAALLAEDIDKKLRLKKIISVIPGFRKDIWWHKALALWYYLSAVLLVALSEVEGGSRTDNLLSKAAMFFIVIVPVPILTNMFSWTDKFEFTRNKTKSSRIFTMVLLSGVSWIIAFVILLFATN